ncbi:MAG: AEC family transporter [Lachnospiraceae bacterium]|nr:AEC family transporter [Lachnospiraceae bacterium]
MGTFFHALSAVFIIFCLMAVGYVLGVFGWMTESEKRFISRYILNIGVPMNTMIGLLNNIKREELTRLGGHLIVPILTISVLLVISLLAGRLLKLPRKQFGVFVSLAFISNTLFIGLPMGLQLFGEVAVPYIMLYYLVSTVFTQTVALLLIEHAGKEEGKEDPGQSAAGRIAALLKDVAKKPPIISLVLCIVFLIVGFRPPDMVMTFAKYLSDIVTPLALMYCGFIVYEMGLKNIRLMKGIPTLLVIRLLIAPLICVGFCLLFHVEGLARNVFIIEAGLPSFTQSTVWAGAFGADERFATVGATLTMLGIFLTVPVMMVLLT